jgi:hypothetical protein
MYTNIAKINYLKKGIGAIMKRLLETVGSVEDNYYGIKSPLRPTFTKPSLKQLNTLLDVGFSERCM